MKYYLYNNTSNILRFIDVGLEIQSFEYFQINQTLQQSYFDGCSIDLALDNNSLFLCKNNQDNPPLQDNILSSFKAKYILNREDSAFEIHYLDSDTQFNKDNMQEVLEHINSIKITDAPLDNRQYIRKNQSWEEVNMLSGNPAGENTQIQFNDNDSFGSSQNFTYDQTENKLKTSGLFFKPENNKVGVWVI